jgi:hypothetical protein
MGGKRSVGGGGFRGGAAQDLLAHCEFRSKPARDSDVKPATIPG